MREMTEKTTYSITVGVVKRLELDNVWVTNYAHDLEFTILTRKKKKKKRVPCFFFFFWTRITLAARAHLEAFVLKDAFDGSIFAAGRQLGLEDNAKGAIAHDLTLGVLHITSLAGNAILDLLTDHLCRPVSQSVIRASCQLLRVQAGSSLAEEEEVEVEVVVVESEDEGGFEVEG